MPVCLYRISRNINILYYYIYLRSSQTFLTGGQNFRKHDPCRLLLQYFLRQFFNISRESRQQYEIVLYLKKTLAPGKAHPYNNIFATTTIVPVQCMYIVYCWESDV